MTEQKEPTAEQETEFPEHPEAVDQPDEIVSDEAEAEHPTEFEPLPAYIPAQFLKQARRAARSLGLDYRSGRHAIELLRARGIDVMSGDMPQEVPSSPEAAAAQHAARAQAQAGAFPQANLPANAPQHNANRAPDISDSEAARKRELEVLRIQRDLIIRRRRRFFLLTVRLLFFVVLPTFLTGYYYYNIATPLYETKSSMLVQSADGGGGMGGMGGLFSAIMPGSSVDSVSVQEYLQSREALLLLEQDHQFKAHFQNKEIDDFKRLHEDASAEEVYKFYMDVVNVSFDPADGLVRMSVVATDPQKSKEFSEALIGYAEVQIDMLSQRVRDDHMEGADGAYQDALSAYNDAGDKVLELKRLRGVLSGEAETALRMQQIGQLETELTLKQTNLDDLMSVARPNRARVDALRNQMERLNTRLEELRGQLTERRDGNASLAEIQAELGIAENELLTRQMMLQSSLQQLETARLEAQKQSKYLATSVSPVAPDRATYPKKLENTAIAFVIFAGIYIMLSLTVSILREQLSA